MALEALAEVAAMGWLIHGWLHADTAYVGSART